LLRSPWQLTVHWPLLHTSPELQGWPQAEQFSRSFSVSTQTPPQLLICPWQLTTHCPSLQASPESHGCPQAEQLAGSESRLTQTSPHITCPSGQSLPVGQPDVTRTMATRLKKIPKSIFRQQSLMFFPSAIRLLGEILSGSRPSGTTIQGIIIQM